MTTIGVSTNTRLLAIAIIKGNGLADYSIHLYKQSWSPTKANLIIKSLEACVRRYCINSIILSIPHEHNQTEAMQYLFSHIDRHFKEKGITVSTEKVQTLYSLCSTQQKKTKKAVMETLSKLFPELQYYYHKERHRKYPYYIKLFEAVGVTVLQKMK